MSISKNAKDEPALAIGGVDTEESEHSEVCPLSVYRSPRWTAFALSKDRDGQSCVHLRSCISESVVRPIAGNASLRNHVASGSAAPSILLYDWLVRPASRGIHINSRGYLVLRLLQSRRTWTRLCYHRNQLQKVSFQIRQKLPENRYFIMLGSNRLFFALTRDSGPTYF